MYNINKLIEFIFICDYTKTHTHDLEFKGYIHLARADPESLLHLRRSSLLLESVNYCHKEFYLRCARIPGSFSIGHI